MTRECASSMAIRSEPVLGEKAVDRDCCDLALAQAELRGCDPQPIEHLRREPGRKRSEHRAGGCERIALPGPVLASVAPPVITERSAHCTRSLYESQLDCKSR